MSIIRHSLLPAALLALTWAWETSAQVPVTDAQGTGRSSSQPSAPPANNQVMVDLFLQLQALQNEIQSLRGIVEEQGYQIRRLEQEARDRYLDLDRRLSAFGTGPSGRNPAAGTDPQSTPPGGAVPAPDNGFSPAPLTPPSAGTAGTASPGIAPAVSAPSTPASEPELYRMALNLLLEESDFEQAISLFQQYIDNYPSGSYITNAYYWQGEALILVSRYNQAKDVFSRIIDEFPNDPKAPGAMLKLGVVYSRMGDNSLATQVWRDIQTRYPESLTEIRAAEDYLRRSGN